MNKLLEIKPDAVGGLPANATPKEEEQFRARFNNSTSVFAGAGSLVSVGVLAWAKGYPQVTRAWRGRR